jgi:hypothetical protein
MPSTQPETEIVVRPGGMAGGCWLNGWALIDELATRQVPAEVELHFLDDGTVDFGWYHPVMAEMMCGLCGKGCREQGKEPCANLFPFCG